VTQAIHGLYAIIDPRFLPPHLTVAAYARALLAGGCRVIQLRVKDESSRETSLRAELARQIMALKVQFDFTFILNDDVALAVELGADGVHVGRDDAPVAAVRAMLWQHALIGYSAHALSEAVAAQSAGADYVALGAIFPTTTKGPGHPVQGIATLAAVVRAVSIPVVAIGGINRTNCDAVLHTGVAAIAMITGLSHAIDVVAETAWYVNCLRASPVVGRRSPVTETAPLTADFTGDRRLTTDDAVYQRGIS